MKEIYVIDVEATGVNPTTADLLQLSALKYSDDISQWQIKNWYFNPRRKIPFEVKQITGLTEEYLEEKSGGLYFDEQSDNLLEIFNPDNLLVGHNIIRYDSSVIRNNFARAGVKLRKLPNMYDTMTEAKKLSYVHTGRWINLTDLYNMSCEHYGLSKNNLIEVAMNSFEFDSHEKAAHNAKYDVVVNALTYYLMRKNLGKI